MDPMVDIPTISAITRAARPLSFREAEYVDFFHKASRARVVLIGEATHGTHEFYRERAWITKRLLQHYGFHSVAVEADWPDAYRVNRFVQNTGHDLTALDSLGDFKRFPAWMWRNMDVLAFVEWLHNFNRNAHHSAGFYGLDLYSLYASAQAVLHYLDKVDPNAAERARYRYGCFDQYGEDSQAYGYAASFDLDASCEQEVIAQLVEMLSHSSSPLTREGQSARDESFYAQQNARLVKNAEQYYRSMFRGNVESWNIRDQHMAETLENLMNYLGKDSKVIVWAHNSHLGDARATDMSRRGELNLGQLIRQRFPEESMLVGFTTYSGEVTAASNWGETAERKIVRRALPNSYEAVFHETGIQDFLLPLKDDPAAHMALSRPRLQRAIGVVYRPETERLSHYFECRLADQFDYVIHFDRTRALVPLEKNVGWEAGEVPETYPHAV